MKPNGARLERVFAALLACAVVVPLAFMPIVPAHDGFQHLLHGYLWNHLQDPGTGYATFLERGSPITAWGFTWIFAPLERLMPWRIAYQASLAILALGLALGARAAVRSIARHETPLGLLGFTFAFSWPFYMGFFPFVSALAASLWLLAFAVRRPNPGLLQHLVFAAGLWVVAMMHMLPAIIVGALVLAYRVSDSEDPERLRNAAATCAAGIPAAAIALLVWNAGAETVQSATATAQNSLFWQPWLKRLVDLGATSVGGPWWRWTPPLAVATLGLFLARKADARARTGATLCALALALALVLPFHMTAWEFLAPRVLPFALICGWGAFARSRALHTPFSASVCALVALSGLCWAHQHNARLAAVQHRLELPLVASADQALRRDGWRLPIVFETPLSFENRLAYAKPFANIGHVFVVEQGGMTPYLFASSPTIHQHIFRSDLSPIRVPERSYFSALHTRAERPALLHALRTDLLAAASAYQDLIIVSDPEAVLLLEQRGFVLDASTPDTQIAHFEGCSLDLEVTHASPGTPLQLAWGWFPLESAAGNALSTASDAGIHRFQPEGVPCADVWLELRTPQGPVSCRPELPTRFVVPLSTDDTATFRCQLTP